MFDTFEIQYDDSILLDDLVQLGLTQQEVGRVFYSEYHVVYPFSTNDYFLIGYTGKTMLIVDFVVNFDTNELTITEIKFANGQDIDNLYCKARC